MPARHLALVTLPLILAGSVTLAQDGVWIGRIFDRLDTDRSGEVTRAEILAAKERQFARADADGDGLVTQAELETIRERLQRFARLGGEALTEGALRMDRDGDGALSRKEYTATSPILILIDADGNGAISRAELDRARAAFSTQP